MQPDPNLFDTHLHPLDPRRVGPDGLASNLSDLFNAAVSDAEIVRCHRALVLAKRDDGRSMSRRRHAVTQASDHPVLAHKVPDNDKQRRHSHR